MENYSEHIKLFTKIAENAYKHFIKNKYCSFKLADDYIFSLIDCTFKGYSDKLFITSKNVDENMYPLLNYDHSCMIYIEVPEDFDDNPDKYKYEFIKDTIKVVAENYLTVLEEDAKGLTGKILPNPNYKK